MVACETCGGSGEVPSDDDGEADRIVRQETQTRTESGAVDRQSVADRQRRHAQMMEQIYQDEARTLAESWRRK